MELAHKVLQVHKRAVALDEAIQSQNNIGDEKARCCFEKKCFDYSLKIIVIFFNDLKSMKNCLTYIYFFDLKISDRYIKFKKFLILNRSEFDSQKRHLMRLKLENDTLEMQCADEAQRQVSF
jgi:hypothetical protein